MVTLYNGTEVRAGDVTQGMSLMGLHGAENVVWAVLLTPARDTTFWGINGGPRVFAGPHAFYNAFSRTTGILRHQNWLISIGKGSWIKQMKDEEWKTITINNLESEDRNAAVVQFFTVSMEETFPSYVSSDLLSSTNTGLYYHMPYSSMLIIFRLMPKFLQMFPVDTPENFVLSSPHNGHVITEAKMKDVGERVTKKLAEKHSSVSSGWFRTSHQDKWKSVLLKSVREEPAPQGYLHDHYSTMITMMLSPDYKRLTLTDLIGWLEYVDPEEGGENIVTEFIELYMAEMKKVSDAKKVMEQEGTKHRNPSNSYGHDLVY